MKILFTLTLVALAIMLPDKASAQLGRGSFEPLGFTFSDSRQFAILPGEFGDLPRIEIAVYGGPAWYAGPLRRSAAVSIFTSGRTGGGYALRVHPIDDVLVGRAHAVILVTPKDEIGNEAQLGGCAARTGHARKWLATSESDGDMLSPPSSLVQATRFC